MKLNKVTFPRKRTAGTYEAEVIGTPKYSKKDKKFTKLEYKVLPTYQEMLDFCSSSGIDRDAALARGIDILRRSAASGGEALSSILFKKMIGDRVRAEITDQKKRERAIRGLVETVLQMKRTFAKKTLETIYAEVVEASKA